MEDNSFEEQSQMSNDGFFEADVSNENPISSRGYMTIEDYRASEEAKQASSEKILYFESDIKKPLIFSLVGLLLSLFGGIGLVFSFVGLFMSTNNQAHKKSQSLRWGKCLGLLGVFMNLLFAAILVIFLMSAASAVEPLETAFLY